MDKIIFRIYTDGEVIALFPQIAGRVGEYSCQSYMHIGQHGASNPHIVIRQTRLVNQKEYLPLLKELEQVGYNPIVAKRCTYKDFQIRQEQAKNWCKMKLSKVDIDKRTESLTVKLLGDPGLKYARKIVAGVKKNLAAEYRRRKNL